MEMTVCTVGRICCQKNPQLFNGIALLLPDIRFVWIGDGDMRGCLSAPNITVTGWKSRDEVMKIVARADVFVLTSLWEGLPIALLEAMYLGCLCVVSDVIGNHDVIRNGLNGFVCSTAEEYAETIRLVAGDAELAADITATARKDVLRNYNADFLAAEYDKKYNSVL